MGPFRQALEERYREVGTAVMGVLNATPDSFYDGGRHVGRAAVARIEELLQSKAFVIDIGGESTRPGAVAVSSMEQLERIESPVKSALELVRKGARIWVSVDTADPVVAEKVLDWGVHLINDVSCLANPDLARVVARANASLLLMHSRGPMAQMSGFSVYDEEGYRDVVADIVHEWTAARDRAERAGLAREDILFDPGIGFAKNAHQSMTVMRRLREFSVLGTAIVVGPSRKSFLALGENTSPETRLGATIAACLLASEQGAMLVRVHDADIVRQALQAWHRLRNAPMPEYGKAAERTADMRENLSEPAATTRVDLDQCCCLRGEESSCSRAS